MSLFEISPNEFMSSFAASVPHTIRSERLRNICRFITQMGLEPVTQLVVDHPSNPSYFAFIPFKDHSIRAHSSNSIHCYAREDQTWDSERFRKWLSFLPVDWKDPSLLIAQQFEPEYSAMLAHRAEHLPEGYRVPEKSETECCTSLILKPDVDISNFYKPVPLPSDLVLDTLRPEKADIEAVVADWPFSYPGVERRFQMLFEKLPTTCIRSRETGALLAYIATNEDGTVGALRVQPGARRRGLAQRVIVDLVLRLRAMGVLPLAEVVRGNQPAQALFEKLGFIDGDRGTYWTRLIKLN